MAASRLKPGAKRSHHGKGKAKEGAVNQGLGVREDLEALRTALSSGKADAGVKEGWGGARRQR